MKKAILFSILFFCAAVVSFGQKPQPARPKTAQPKPAPTAQTKTVAAAAETEISSTDWTTLAAALEREDWDVGASLARQFIDRLKIDNEKKQLARLRYSYLYALAGKIFRLSNAQNADAETSAREELIRAAARFTNREFVLPAREFLIDCKGVVNYICPAKDGGGKLFRTTATSKDGAEIHSFDYVAFDRAVDLKAFAGDKTFLGGVLRRVEFNDDLTKSPWLMRLVFDKGFVRVELVNN